MSKGCEKAFHEAKRRMLSHINPLKVKASVEQTTAELAHNTNATVGENVLEDETTPAETTSTTTCNTTGYTRPEFCNKHPDDGICKEKGVIRGDAFSARNNIRWYFYNETLGCQLHRWNGCGNPKNLFLTCHNCTTTCTDKDPVKDCDGFP
ncbi:uncharacterized protein LOC125946704 isoform X3 [Dermacentor silvarum]|uniref:uncharacterized protein LOC125946704 isoform X3 n=1 Tax=Dermacentor silvarum TaxID=543639 RepID=UPI00210164CA|nr:uncharacterized protein LOC125946704 isoform X3 [Dermacentor silvarum]